MNNINIDIVADERIDFEEKLIKISSLVLDNHEINNIVFLTISFIDSSETIELNRKYRNKEKDTDVLSFEYYDNLHVNKPLVDEIINLGDIFISIDYVKQQAIDLGNTYEEECIFLVLHATLHLLGYDHNTKEEEYLMFEKQKEILEIFKG